jgi:hypothetical protein
MRENPIAKLGLPQPINDGTADAHAEVRAEAIFQGEIILGALFKYFTKVMGQPKARELFAPFAPKPARGRRVGLDRDAYLLLIYDRVCKTTPDLAAVPRIAAIGIDANAPGKYGLSIEAIEKHIRRLVKERAATKLA